METALRDRALAPLRLALASAVLVSSMPASPPWDTRPDTWVATDALGRAVPGHDEVGPPRGDRFVGIFYFLWLGAHVNGGPWDIARILREYPDAMATPTSPPWGPLGALHHWGESIFGYYVSDDPYVLRRHARMLADAGVDAVVFDVTNQITYRKNYLALLDAFAEVRASGREPPRVAFLCPFWNPAKVVAELWRDLYEPGIRPELWFRWEGKPLILADPDLLEPVEEHGRHDVPARLESGRTLGQSFLAEKPFVAVGGCFPTWREQDSAMTLTLYRAPREGTGPAGDLLLRERFERIADNAWIELRSKEPLPAGAYYLEMSEPKGAVGWWTLSSEGIRGGTAHADGKPAGGHRTLRIRFADELVPRLREFFTFRAPQPDYFRGPTKPDMWSWLEVYPQHVFRNARGEKEEMSVSVAQNAVGDRLGAMSEPGARGRSFRRGERDPAPDAVRWDRNFAEQCERALAEDPKFIFVTGWNEWVASRFAEFNGVRLPVLFVDEFDEEHSRDIEPMRGGHGDNTYYQLVSFVRRFKGARAEEPASPPRTIRFGRGFSPWADVRPEFRDDIGDVDHRDHPGYNDCERYVNRTGRNDIVCAKATHDAATIWFYARTREALTPRSDPAWMLLFLDIDRDRRTGWEGYDFVANRVAPPPGSAPGTAFLERNAGGWTWREAARVEIEVEGNELAIAIPRAALGLGAGPDPPRVDFKWADGVPDSGDILRFYLDGDVAPNGRFNYRYEGAPGR